MFDGDENILVSASAGSGKKPPFLVRRVIEKVKSGVDIDRLLIVTYTEAAAREMKKNVSKWLYKKAMNEEQKSRKEDGIFFSSNCSFANSQYQHVTCLFV